MNLFVDKIKRNFSDYGFKITVKKLFFKILSIVYERNIYRIYKKDLLNTDDFDLKNINSEYIFREINENEYSIINKIEFEAEWLRDELKNRIKRGDVCYCIFDNNNLVGFNLISFNRIYMPLVKYYKIFNSVSAWSEHISINKMYRKQGIASILRKNVFKKLKKLGFKWLYGGCLIDNKASLNLARSLDFKEFTDIFYYKIFGRKYWKIKRIKKDDKLFT